jgi:hypothetical protein
MHFKIIIEAQLKLRHSKLVHLSLIVASNLDQFLRAWLEPTIRVDSTLVGSSNAYKY